MTKITNTRPPSSYNLDYLLGRDTIRAYQKEHKKEIKDYMREYMRGYRKKDGNSKTQDAPILQELERRAAQPPFSYLESQEKSGPQSWVWPKNSLSLTLRNMS
jgi:hypothetical protein